METALLLQVRSIICDPTWSNKDPSWRPVFIFESVIALLDGLTVIAVFALIL